MQRRFDVSNGHGDGQCHSFGAKRRHWRGGLRGIDFEFDRFDGVRGHVCVDGSRRLHLLLPESDSVQRDYRDERHLQCDGNGERLHVLDRDHRRDSQCHSFVTNRRQ